MNIRLQRILAQSLQAVLLQILYSLVAAWVLFLLAFISTEHILLTNLLRLGEGGPPLARAIQQVVLRLFLSSKGIKIGFKLKQID